MGGDPAVGEDEDDVGEAGGFAPVVGDVKDGDPGAVMEVGEDGAGIEQAKEREELRARAEQIGAQPVPLPGGGREELLRLRVAAGDDVVHPRGVALKGRMAGHVLAQATVTGRYTLNPSLRA